VLPDADERARVLARVEEHALPVREADGEPVVSDPSGTTLVLGVSH
jgi:hypothetical protein